MSDNVYLLVPIVLYTAHLGYFTPGVGTFRIHSILIIVTKQAKVSPAKSLYKC